MTKNPEKTTLALPSGYAVDVSSSPEQLLVRAPDGRVCIRVRLTAAGPEVEIEAASLAVTSRGAIALSGERLVLDGREGIALRSGGDIVVEADGKLQTRAFEQHLEATKGDFCIEANDDVRVDGERIRLNSPEAQPLRRLNGELEKPVPTVSGTLSRGEAEPATDEAEEGDPA